MVINRYRRCIEELIVINSTLYLNPTILPTFIYGPTPEAWGGCMYSILLRAPSPKMYLWGNHRFGIHNYKHKPRYKGIYVKFKYILSIIYKKYPQTRRCLGGYIDGDSI